MSEMKKTRKEKDDELDLWPVMHHMAYGQHSFSPDGGSFVICRCGRHAVWEDGAVTTYHEPGSMMREMPDNSVTHPAPQTDRCLTRAQVSAARQRIERRKAKTMIALYDETGQYVLTMTIAQKEKLEAEQIAARGKLVPLLGTGPQ